MEIFEITIAAFFTIIAGIITIISYRNIKKQEKEIEETKRKVSIVLNKTAKWKLAD